MIAEPDDNTLNNAGPEGRHLADTWSGELTKLLDPFDAKKGSAIARIVADTLYDYAEERER